MVQPDWSRLTEAGYVELSEAAERMKMSVEAVNAMAKTGTLRSMLVGGIRLVQPAIVSGAIR